MIKPSPTCWLYLNCEDMTGKPPDQCPNRKRCKRNAKHSPNYYCELPYTYQKIDPQYDQLFDHEEKYLVVHRQLLSEEAIAAGWMAPERLFYSYQNNTLLIGICPRQHYFLLLPLEAEAMGFARAEHTPYGLNSEPGRLVVTRYEPVCTYPKHFLEAGWAPSLNIPYSVIERDSSDDTDDPILKRGLYVGFPSGKPEYEEAIAAGWHPPVPLPQYDTDPDEGFEEYYDEDEW